MTQKSRPATADDVHEAALAMPHVRVEWARDNPVYQVGGKSFVFFRNPRKDALDPVTGEPYDDVIVIWVGGEGDKQALVQDADGPFFTTSHFDGHPSVLVRASRLGDVSRDEIVELVQEAWLAQASRRRADAWLAEHGVGPG
ncbi:MULTISPECIES: MmcQ/YjbR family DNA-binding protein [unclassified Knoellia]|uniref:MmcQ/YjbR family DNA-binding protein n=1 Tax=Knoellia altitudinis TaxID=3404795 RepID=UPI00361DD147